MKYWAQIILLTISSFVSAEWLNLNVLASQGLNFKTEVSPLLKGLSVGLGSPDIHYPTGRHRFYTGLSVNRLNSAYCTGLIPMGFGAIAPSKNLTLHGTFSAFQSGSDLVLSTGYGMRIVLGMETPNPWFLTLNNATLKGSSYVRFRTMNLGLYRWSTILGVSFVMGLDYHVIKGSFSFQDGSREVIKENFTLPFIGFPGKIGTFTVTPKLSWHPSIMVLSLELGLNIY